MTQPASIETKRWNGKIDFIDGDDATVCLDTTVYMTRVKGNPLTEVSYDGEGIKGVCYAVWPKWGFGLYRQVQQELRVRYIAERLFR